jgi:hypothetical protein
MSSATDETNPPADHRRCRHPHSPAAVWRTKSGRRSRCAEAMDLQRALHDRESSDLGTPSGSPRGLCSTHYRQMHRRSPPKGNRRRPRNINKNFQAWRGPNVWICPPAGCGRSPPVRLRERGWRSTARWGSFALGVVVGRPISRVGHRTADGAGPQFRPQWPAALPIPLRPFPFAKAGQGAPNLTRAHRPSGDEGSITPIQPRFHRPFSPTGGTRRSLTSANPHGTFRMWAHLLDPRASWARRAPGQSVGHGVGGDPLVEEGLAPGDVPDKFPP